MDKMQLCKVSTNDINHYFFGFHDLIAFNKSDQRILSLETPLINRPPLPGEEIKVGYADVQNCQFTALGITSAFNYPQGARQQWIDDSNFIVNNRVGDNWGSDVYDCILGKKIHSFESTSHCISRDSKYAYGLDYERIHRLGGYGYIGLDDPCKHEAAPSGQGIWILDLQTGTKKILLSIKEVANHDPLTSSTSSFHHYVTHLVLNPIGTRIAFLHRFFLPDGGIRTRLMTIGTDGSDLRCLATGFLSHFDWKDNETIFIWGRAGTGMDQLRSNPFFSNPFINPMIKIAKIIVRKVLKNVSNQLNMTFLLVSDGQDNRISPAAQGILTEDGHPMINPIHRDFMVNDNYPNNDGDRTLMLYQFSRNLKTDLGTFRRMFSLPDTSLFNEYTRGVDSKILSLVTSEQYSFTRSGLHCDLHPRWNANGTKVSFDSIHEGSRQLYWMDVEDYIKK